MPEQTGEREWTLEVTPTGYEAVNWPATPPLPESERTEQ